MKTKFEADIAELLEMPRKKLISNLEILPVNGWDSLVLVSMIALIDKHFGKQVDTIRLASCKTYSDILEVVGAVDAIEN